MEPIETRTYNLRGSHYAIGCQLGKQAASNEYLKAKYVVKEAVDQKQIRETTLCLNAGVRVLLKRYRALPTH